MKVDCKKRTADGANVRRFNKGDAYNKMILYQSEIKVNADRYVVDVKAV